jgi:hypothetical protein
MKNKLIALLGILFLGVVGYVIYSDMGKPSSPTETVSYNDNGLGISVTYCRPSKRGRLIFGGEEEKALVPYGKYWRTGANEATEIEFNQDVMFGGKELKKGRYVLYTVPNKSTWKVVLNSELGRWGYSPADRNLDVLEVDTNVEENSEEVEMFTFKVQKLGDKNAQIQILWDKTKVVIPVELKS